ncbi:hypothetical protein ACWDZ8_09895 [Streptomyces sp. NPDC003233]
MRRRLARISEPLDVDLPDPGVRMELWFARHWLPYERHTPLTGDDVRPAWHLLLQGRVLPLIEEVFDRPRTRFQLPVTEHLFAPDHLAACQTASAPALGEPADQEQTAPVREPCRLAVARHGLRTLRAPTSRNNAAPQRVLTKAGFAPVGPADPTDLGGEPGTWYQLDLVLQP